VRFLNDVCQPKSNGNLWSKKISTRDLRSRSEGKHSSFSPYRSLFFLIPPILDHSFFSGSGKTLISVLLMKYYLKEIQNKLESGSPYKQLIAFIAPTKILVGQQTKYLSGNLSNHVRAYTGDTKSFSSGSILDTWGIEQWSHEIEEVDILVMTPEIMRNILERNLIPLSRFDLFVLDECHHAFGKDPMAAVCRYIHHHTSVDSYHHRPRILGLTASPLPCKKGSISQKIAELERTTGCKIVAPVDSLADLHFHVPKPLLYTLRKPSSSHAAAVIANLSSCPRRPPPPSQPVLMSLPYEEILQNPQVFSQSRVSSLVYEEYKTNSNVMSAIYSVTFPPHSVIEEGTTIFPHLNPIHFLYHTFYRIRQGQHLQEILILLNTLHAEISDFTQLSGLERYVSLLREHERNSSSSSSKQSLPLFISDLESLISQLAKISGDCGVIPCLHAFLAALTTSTTVSPKTSKKSTPPSSSTTSTELPFPPLPSATPAPVVIEHGFVWRNENESLFNPQALLPSIYSMTRMKRERQHRSADAMMTISCIDMTKYQSVVTELWAGPFLRDELINTESYLLICHPVELMLVTLFDLLAFFIFSLDHRCTARALSLFNHTVETEGSRENESNLGVPRPEPGTGPSWVFFLQKLFEIKCKSSTLSFQPGTGGVFYSSLFRQSVSGEGRIKISEVEGGFRGLLQHGLLLTRSLLETFSADQLIELIMKDSSDGIGIDPKNSNLTFQAERLKIALPEDYYQLVTLESSSPLVDLPDGHHGDVHPTIEGNYVPASIYRPVLEVVTTPLPTLHSVDESHASPLCNNFYLLSPRVCMMLRDLFSNRTDTWGNVVNWTTCTSTDGNTVPTPEHSESSNEEDHDDDDDEESNSTTENQWAAIVFCKMRLTVLALNSLTDHLVRTIAHSKLVHELREERMNNSEQSNRKRGDNIQIINEECKKCFYLIRPTHVIGGYHMTIQGKRLLEFKTGIFNVLFATDIAEEGLDVRACQRVINFDLPCTVKSYVQRRGRARAQNSIMLNLIPEDKTSEMIYQELISLLKQEEEMNQYGGGGRDGAGANTSVGDVMRCMMKEEDGGEGALDELESYGSHGDQQDYIDTASLPLLPDCDESMYRYVVPTTGAVVDINNATQLLLHYCQHIPHDKYYKPDPIYWISTQRAYSFTSQIGGGGRGGLTNDPTPTSLYQCSLLLPQNAPPQLRCLTGPLVSSKVLAKSLLSLECVKQLYQCGELDNSLQSIHSKSALQRKINQQQLLLQQRKEEGEQGRQQQRQEGETSGAKGDGEEMSSMKYRPPSSFPSSCRVKDENNPEGITQIDVKVTPDQLDCHASASLDFDPLTQTLHFYSFQTHCHNPNHQKYINHCPTCSRYVRSMSCYGLILHQKIPQEVCDELIDFYIRGLRVDVSLEYLGSKVVSEEELEMVQLFHRNILCWESDGSHPPLPITPPVLWKKSGNDAWYLIYPLRFTGAPAESSMANRVKEIDFILSSDWLIFLTECRHKTTLLVNNFFKHQRQTTLQQQQQETLPSSLAPPPSAYHLNASQTPEDLYDKVYSRSGWGNIYIGCESDEDKRVLDDVMKVLVSEGSGNESTLIQPKGDEVGEEGMEREIKVTTAAAAGPITYRDYYLSKGLITQSEVQALAEISPSLPLVQSVSLAGRLSLVQILDQVVTKAVIIEEEHTHSAVTYLLPQHCEIIGEVKWMMIGLVAPSMIWRIQSLLLALEAREKISLLMPPNEPLQVIQSCPYLKHLPPSPSLSTDANNYQLPSPSLMLKALTPRMTQEILDSERLEFIGDVILKYVVSWILYCQHWKSHEGFLTRARVEIISNAFLTKRCRQLDFLQYLRAHTLSSGKQELYFSPPGRVYSSLDNDYGLQDTTEEDKATMSSSSSSSAFSLWNVNILKPVKMGKGKEVLLDNRITHSTARGNKFASADVKGKRIADLIEALIGAYYEAGGINCAIGVIRAFGLWPTSDETQTLYPLPKQPIEAQEEILLPTIPPDYPIQLARIALGPFATSPEIVFSSSSERNLSLHRSNCIVTPHTVSIIAHKMGYHFQNLFLLDEALTHCSVIHKSSNQRLEYLGDAVLDYATMSLLYGVLPSSSSQGQLSTLKCRLLCNHNLAKIAMKMRLYRHIFVMSTKLMNQLGDLEIWNQSDEDQPEGEGEGEGEGEEEKQANLDKLHEEILQKIDGKFLADVVESLIGAVFIDSNCSIEVICEVVKYLEIIPRSYFA
jgi:dsRNA-specific ribonuclease